MKIKLDENMPAGLVSILQELGHEVDTIPQEGLDGEADSQVWSAAQEEKRFLITQDLDFSDVRRYKPGTHYGLLLVRLRNPGRRALTRKVQQLFQSEAVGEWQGCFIVATENKLRIRKPA
jgi:predicted nuclease of predicted toxin-antitoxin system